MGDIITYIIKRLPVYYFNSGMITASNDQHVQYDNKCRYVDAASKKSKGISTSLKGGDQLKLFFFLDS